MIKISKKADYAVLVMANLAHRTLANGGAESMPPASAQDIADQVGLSRALVANILKRQFAEFIQGVIDTRLAIGHIAQQGGGTDGKAVDLVKLDPVEAVAASG